MGVGEINNSAMHCVAKFLISREIMITTKEDLQEISNLNNVIVIVKYILL